MFVLSFALNAITLPDEHFLFPRDREIMWISGVEDAVSNSELRSLAKQCRVIREFDSCDWIEQFKQAEIQNLDTFQFSEQIVFLGERHIDPTHQAALNDIIHKNDFQVLALEMVNHGDQTFLDQYLSNQISLAVLEEVFSRAWNYESSGYMKAIESAKQKGMKIIALDDRALFNRETFSENLRKRDEQMAKVLNDYLIQKPNERILVYSGKMHAFKLHSREGKIKSLRQLVHAQDMASYFLFGPKEKNLMTNSFKMFIQTEQSKVVKSHSFSDYIEGAIFIK